MSRRELQLQKRIVDAIIAIGGVARIRTQTPYTTVGDPDIYGSYNGIHFEIEVKEDDEQPTAIQRKRLKEWKESGAISFVARSVPEAIRKLDITARKVDSRR